MTTFTAAPSAQQAKQPVTPPATSILDLVRLVGRLGKAVLSGRKATIGAVLGSWMQEIMRRHKTRAIIVKAGPKRILVAADPDFSRAVLEPAPSETGFVAGALKFNAMSYLAPRALTIAHGADWTVLRRFNEQVLSTGHAHAHAQAFLVAVREAFRGPVFTIDDIRNAMSHVMLKVVLGEKADPRVATDIRELFALVQSPVRRRFAGGRGRELRHRFYAQVRTALTSSDASDASLAGAARQFGELIEADDILQQVPHWMFTFAGSGADLLARALALVCARPQMREHLLKEIEVAGSLDDARTILQLDYLEACLREAGRLFPPVTKTFHRAPGGALAGGYTIAPNVEVLHYLPLLYRTASRTPDKHEFRPERWLSKTEERPYPDIFLSGPRACPGQDLILFVCKAAAATLLQRGIAGYSDSLKYDPLPLTFPEKETRFMTPVTTERARVQDARELLALNQQQLDELFAASQPGPIPAGKGDGIAMYKNGTLFGSVARHLISWFVWKGKFFRSETQDLKNRLTPFGILGIRAKVYVDKSWKAPGDAIILDYSKTSFVASFIRDEIRQVGPGIYLGKVFLGKKHALDFSVSFK